MPAASTGGDPMPLRVDRYFRLESRPNDLDLQNGFAARVHDPLWLLARQWQMGEHQGENASSPVRVDTTVVRSRIAAVDGNPAFDPAVIPAEALVESELDDWWTMGRRIRVGDRFKDNAAVVGASALVFDDPPPPYDAFAGRPDGRAIWRARETLHIGLAAFGADTPPQDSPSAWDSRKLNYNIRFETPERPLDVTDHRGGPMDWYSADVPADAAPVPELPAKPMRPSVPSPLEYPGAPASRFWEIENAAVDIGGYPPDTAHFATMLLVDLIYSHSDDWFLFPLTGKAGHIVTIRSLTVTDSFGKSYASTELTDVSEPRYPGLLPPTDFSIFETVGLDPASLVLWPVAESPIESAAIERVQFGTDEQSNALWALERVVDSREVTRGPNSPQPGDQPYPAPTPVANLQGVREYNYLPGIGMETHWHPYQLDWEGKGGPAFVLGGLADYSLQVPGPMPRPRAEVLKNGAAPEKLHRISPAVVAPGGFELERRWQLARDMEGRPVLWIQRQRRNLRTPPARTLRFDLMVETDGSA